MTRSLSINRSVLSEALWKASRLSRPSATRRSAALRYQTQSEVAPPHYQFFRRPGNLMVSLLIEVIFSEFGGLGFHRHSRFRWRSRATRTSWLRVRTPLLVNSCWRVFLTALSEITNLAAIS